VLAYLGTPELAVPPLRALLAAGHEVGLVVTGPDRRRGRGAATSPSPVKAAALEAGLEVTHDPDDLLGRGFDLGVVVAYGRLLRPHHLAEMPFVNLHFSLLPRWRGAAPVERAILAGDERTGVCLMEVTEGLDEGGVYACESVQVGDKDLDTLRAELVALGTQVLLRALERGLGDPVPQSGEPTYAAKLTVEDRRLDPSMDPVQMSRVVRVGGAWVPFRDGRLKVLDAELVDGRFRPRVVQSEGRRPTGYDEWCRGARPAPEELPWS
jgi:methionyl-tRNA formyltransferase